LIRNLVSHDRSKFLLTAAPRSSPPGPACAASARCGSRLTGGLDGRLSLTLDNADFTDSQATAAIAHITGGNFRLLHQPFVRIERILRTSDLTVITSEVIDAARSTLVIGDATQR
jgi:hypothetical protein